MKIEVGKTYLNRDGREVRIVRGLDGPEYHFRDSEGETYTHDGRWLFERAISHMDLVSEAPDLTQITTPFGLLDEETQKALKAHGGDIQYYHSNGSWAVKADSPLWHKSDTYRAKPVIKRETIKGECYALSYDTLCPFFSDSNEDGEFGKYTEERVAGKPVRIVWEASE